MRRLLALLCLLCVSAPAWASVTTNAVVTTQTPNNGKQNFIQGTDSAGTFKTIYTAGANGSKCTGMSVANTDSSATHLVSFEITNGGNTYLTSSLTTVSPGVGATGSANAMSAWVGLPSDSDGNPYVFLVSGDVLKATFASALTGSLTPLAQITVLITCADF